MMVLQTGAAVALGVALLVFLLAVSWMLFLGLRMRGEAVAIGAENARLHATIRSAPALAMLVRPDGRVEMPQRLVDWFGPGEPARMLGDLHRPHGLSAEDAAALEKDVVAVQRSGRNFERSVRPQGSARALTLRGTRAPVVGVSPIVAGRPVRGHADACLAALGLASTAGAVAGLYEDFLDGWLVDDAAGDDLASVRRRAGLTVRSRPLLMTDVPSTAAIAGAALDLADELQPHRASA